MTLLEKLKAARAKIESGWTQRRYARDKDGFSCLENGPNAVAWCAAGALHSTEPNNYHEICYRIHPLSAAVIKLGYASIVAFNDADGRTGADVLALYDRAIEIEKNRINDAVKESIHDR